MHTDFLTRTACSIQIKRRPWMVVFCVKDTQDSAQDGGLPAFLPPCAGNWRELSTIPSFSSFPFCVCITSSELWTKIIVSTAALSVVCHVHLGHHLQA